MPNCMKGIHIFPLLIVGSFYFIFSYQVNGCPMHGHSQEGTNKILFQNPFKLMFNKYSKQCKVGGASQFIFL
jgi:hypothetical protein